MFPVNKRKAYRASNVNNVQFDEIVRTAAGRRVSLRMDVGKYEILSVLRWRDGGFERPWKIKNPSESRLFAERLRSLEFRGTVAALVGPVSYDANSLAAHRRYIPGKRFELPDSVLPGTAELSEKTTSTNFHAN